MEKRYQDLAQWIESQAEKIAFGEIIIKIVRHQKQTRYIEKSVLVREQQPTGVTHGER